ncbi:MAG: c-type cytochrome [Steroidobacteraceae bacterium]
MRKTGFATAVAVAALSVSCAALGAPKSDPPPRWAFMLLHEESDPTPASKPITVPGSALHMTEKAIDDPFAGADWFAEDHPAMPEVVAKGHRPHLWACSYCHGPTGVGDPASAALAGLPAAYIEQQLTEFRAGRRQCAVAKTACGEAMPRIAGLVSAADARAAAIYFSKLRYRPRVHVVEAAMVPKNRYGSLFPVKLASGGKEPLGARILEMPDNVALEDDGDWRASITAYVPPGSVARGKALVESGAGALPCASCHGPQLQGVGMVPPLAGRTPTYIVRQLYDIQYGHRLGAAVAPMAPEVAHLTARDRIAIAAYLASLSPSNP